MDVITFLNFFKILPCTLTIKVRGLIYLCAGLKSWTRDMYHTPLSQLKEQNHGGGGGKPPPNYIRQK